MDAHLKGSEDGAKACERDRMNLIKRKQAIKKLKEQYANINLQRLIEVYFNFKPNKGDEDEESLSEAIDWAVFTLKRLNATLMAYEAEVDKETLERVKKLSGELMVECPLFEPEEMPEIAKDKISKATDKMAKVKRDNFRVLKGGK